MNITTKNELDKKKNLAINAFKIQEYCLKIGKISGPYSYSLHCPAIRRFV